MSRCKNMQAYLYIPTVSGAELDFCGLLDEICSMDINDRTVKVDEDNYIISVVMKSDMYVITIQALKGDELPKVANASDGTDESDLAMPEGKTLSYKNVFVYNRSKHIMAAAKLSMCPQVGRLSGVLSEIALREDLIAQRKHKIRFKQLFEKGLVDRLQKASTISSATITSKDYYGDYISSEKYREYKDYLCGTEFEKETRIKGRKGASIKNIVQFIVDDFISGNEIVGKINVKMCIDGEDVDFGKYFVKRAIGVMMDERNNKYADYDSLLHQLCTVIDEYTVDV